MKIAYINIRSPNPVKGSTGRTVHIQEVCKAWQKMGHDVFIITGNPLSISADVNIYNLSVPTPLSFDRFRREITLIPSSVYQKIKGRNRASIISKKERKFSTNIASNNFTKLSWSPRVLYRDIVQIINEYQYDKFVHENSKEIIETEKPDFLYQRLVFGGFAGSRLSKEYSLPLILEVNASNTFQNEWTTQHSNFFNLAKKCLENKLCRRAEAIIVVNSFIKEYFVKQNISPNKIFLNPNGVDLERYYPDDKIRQKIRNQYGLDDRMVVGFLGNFRSWHDINIIIKSARVLFNKMPKAHFLLIGDGPSRCQFEKMAINEGLEREITFTGNVPNEEVPGYINAIDIAVAPIPKGTYFHCSPLKIFEYLAVGKPVIVSRYPDIELIINDHKNGILVEPGDEVQLADAILELSNNKELREQLGREGRRTVEKNYTWEKNVKNILDIYETIRY